MDREEIVFTVIMVMLFVATIGMAGVSAMHVYDARWEWKLANQHLDLAQSSSDIRTQNVEITKAIEILRDYPRSGNWDLLNKLNAKSNMASAWQSLEEMKSYTVNAMQMNKTDSAYQLAVYNVQEKIQYFQDNYKTAFTDYQIWGLGGWMGGVSIIIGAVAAFFAITGIGILDNLGAKMIHVVVLVLIFLALFVAIYIDVSPVLYKGLY